MRKARRNTPFRGWTRPGSRRGRWIKPFVLLLIAEGPIHGYSVIGQLNRLGLNSDGVDVGVVYRTLREFEAEALVKTKWGLEEGRPTAITSLHRKDMGVLGEWVKVMVERRRLIKAFLDRTRHIEQPRRELDMGFWHHYGPYRGLAAASRLVRMVRTPPLASVLGSRRGPAALTQRGCERRRRRSLGESPRRGSRTKMDFASLQERARDLRDGTRKRSREAIERLAPQAGSVRRGLLRTWLLDDGIGAVFEAFFDGSEGRVFYRRWDAEVPPVRLTLIVHGYAEHGGRYGHVAAELTRRGSVAYADHDLGHGRSDGERALISDFEHVVDDLHTLVGIARDEHPDLPLVLVGHSMGGLLSARFAQRSPGRGGRRGVLRVGHRRLGLGP